MLFQDLFRRFCNISSCCVVTHQVLAWYFQTFFFTISWTFMFSFFFAEICAKSAGEARGGGWSPVRFLLLEFRFDLWRPSQRANAAGRCPRGSYSALGCKQRRGHSLSNGPSEVDTQNTYVITWVGGGGQAGHKLWRARSRLYQRRFLQPNSHFAAFFKIYRNSFAPFQISFHFLSYLGDFLEKSAQFRNFHGRKQICQIFAKISRIFFGISQKFHDFADCDVEIALFS
jgi:hypothetical protein